MTDSKATVPDPTPDKPNGELHENPCGCLVPKGHNVWRCSRPVPTVAGSVYMTIFQCVECKGILDFRFEAARVEEPVIMMPGMN